MLYLQDLSKLCLSSVQALYPSSLSELSLQALCKSYLQLFVLSVHSSSPSKLSNQPYCPTSSSNLSIQALPPRSVQAFSKFCPSSSFQLSLQALHLNSPSKAFIKALCSSSVQALSSLKHSYVYFTSLMTTTVVLYCSSSKPSLRCKSVMCLLSFWLSSITSYNDLKKTLSWPRV